jgi:uncharacterized cupredoxin-like copper-binding protein
VKKLVLGGSLAVLASLALALAALGATGAPAPQKVAVGMTEFKFTLVPKTVKRNVPVTFTVTNKGAIGHDFKVAGKKTAVLSAGKKATLKVTFKKAGKYAYLCTLPSHAAAGMKGTLTVK